ncbi:MAG: penicillin-binding protein activator [Chromatiales bacterium]|nr:penicillin-binding protein activator [Chromatiales bacterium]
MQKILTITTLLLLLLAGGCGTQPSRHGGGFSDEKAADAAEAMHDGDFTHAARLYNELANDSQLPQQYEYRYLEAVALFRAGFPQHAGQILEAIPSTALPTELQLKHQLLSAEIVLKRDPDLTLSLLLNPAVDAGQLPGRDDLFARYHLLRARAFARLGNHLETAREYLLREFYLTETPAIEANQLSIWQALSLLTPQALEQLRVAPPPDALSGWMELIAISKDYTLSPATVSQKLTAWRQRYIAHPASEQILIMLLDRSKELASRPANIALLLPLSGRYARAGTALQDGILAAYYSDTQRGQITLRSYDIGETEGEQILATYRQAVDEGAEFIIGPLEKSAVATLAQQSDLPVPTLALNYAEESDNDQLYQYSLAPEDEAREVAERAWHSGYMQAAVLVPDNSLGERLSLAFNQRWQELGGVTVSESRYLNDQNDFSTPIKLLLNINDSELRERRVRQLLGEKVEFSPRRRQDIDFVFLAASPRQARLIRPQMKFHHASDLPLLATSHLYDGKPNRAQDRDMDEILFCDMPWTLNAASSRQALKEQHRDEFKPHAGQLQRLLAMGIDAYQLVPLLPMLEGHPYERYRGETGQLHITEGRRVNRNLQWARFERGIAQLQQESFTDDGSIWQYKP